MKYDDEERARHAAEADAETIALLQRELEDHQKSDDEAGFTTLAVPFAFAATFALAAMVGPVFAVLAFPATFALAIAIVPPDNAWHYTQMRRARRARQARSTMARSASTALVALAR